MRNTTLAQGHFSHQFMHYARIAFLSEASVFLLFQPAAAQQSAEQTDSYHYDITTFISKVLPLNSVYYTNRQAAQMNRSALALSDDARALSASAKEIRKMENPGNHTQALTLSKKADSLDAVSDAKNLEAAQTFTNAEESQYETNADQLSMWQNKTHYSTDILTSANLLVQESGIYYSKALSEAQQFDTAQHVYIKQNYIDLARKDMETALLKQQGAEDIYISLEKNNSTDLAKKIDSILSVPNIKTLSKDNATDFGKIVFCVQVGSFSGIVPLNKANKLLRIAGLGITKHNEVNGVTTFTIGAYNSFTSATLLSDELVNDGYSSATVVTYTTTGQQTDNALVIAKSR